jgi:hypothetical protein
MLGDMKEGGRIVSEFRGTRGLYIDSTEEEEEEEEALTIGYLMTFYLKPL